MCSPAQSFDVRMLILKRWNQAQVGKLFDGKAEQRGQYVAFQNHHFIDICSAQGDSALFHVYEQLRVNASSTTKGMGSGTNKGHFDDIHTVQSMTLLGESGTFWNTAADVLHITFIQLNDSTRWEYDEIRQQISDILSKRMDSAWARAEWALYYSLDFCDLVLFTKHVKMKPLNDLLWEMALLKTVRDTFTTSCFEYTFLKTFFEKEQQDASGHKEFLTWDDHLALSINFSIKDMSVLPNLLKSISEVAGSFRRNRLFGRYDFRITTDSLSGDQILRILFKIDALFNDQNDNPQQPFNSYEVVLLAAPWDNECPRKTAPSVSSTFESRVNETLDELYNLCICVEKPFTGYVLETLRALHELNSSGFSEEFILSVLPSFSTFIKLMKQGVIFQAESQTDSEYTKIENCLLQIQKNYFSALNTLALCTMHSERQFIHAPALNASYFEIPPKMLAFYSAITDHIASLLAESENKKYNYLIAPDFRTDIYVKPLNIHYTKDTTGHLAIINLPEKYFYQPEQAIMLLAHEVGHYEGERNRERRAKHIFEMVGLLLLQHTPLINPEQKKISRIAQLFAREFGDFLYEQYNDSGMETVRGIKAALDDVAGFLSDSFYGLKYFAEEEFPQILAQRWANALYQNREKRTICRECRKLLQSFDQSLYARYFSSLVNEVAFSGACDVIARSTVNHLSTLLCRYRRPELQDIFDMGEAILQAFSEAFADKQMLRVMGKCFNPEDYRYILKDAQKDIGAAATEQMLRYNAVRCIEQSIPVDDYFALQDSFQDMVVKSIVSYLRSVEDDMPNQVDDWCMQTWEEKYFSASDWLTRCRIICDVLTDYKQCLILRLQTNVTNDNGL